MVICSGIYWIVKNNLFEIKKTEINLVETSCVTKDQVLEKLSLLNQNIFLFEKSLDINVFKNQFFCVKSVQVEKHYPNQVLVTVNGRIPIANVLTVSKVASSSASASATFISTSSAKEDSFLVDDEGIIFAKEFKQNLVNVSFVDQKFILGQKIEKNIIQPLLEIIKRLKDLSINIEYINVQEDTITLVYKPIIFFTTKRDVNKQVASLQLILEKAKIEAKELELIDVRFEKPIIKYAPVKK